MSKEMQFAPESPSEASRLRKEHLMRDALRLGKLEAKDHLEAKLKEAKANQAATVKLVDAAWDAFRDLLRKDAREGMKLDPEIQTLVKLVNKLMRPDASKRLRVSQLMEKNMCFCTNKDDRWISITDNYSSHRHTDVVTANVLSRGMITMCCDGPLLLTVNDGRDIDELSEVYLRVKPSDKTMEALHDYRALLGVYFEQDATINEIEAMQADLPATLKRVEAGILKARLRAEGPDAEAALLLVETAINAHVTGNVTARLM